MKPCRKSKPKPSAYNKLIEQKRELSSITSKLDQQPMQESINAVFAAIKNFFNTVTPAEYQFSYSEIKKEQLEKELSESLKDKLCKFSKDISDVRFSDGEIKKSELKEIIKQAQQLINSTANEEKLISTKREHEKLKKTFPIKTIKYILDSFAPDKGEISVEKIKEKIDIKKKSKNILHKLGIIKTLAEKELERKRKYREKLKKLKIKEHVKEQKKRRKEEEKRRKKLLKLKAKQQKDHLKWLETQRRIREIQRKQEEKRERRLARAKAVRDYLHNKLGLFKTVKDLEKELEEKRKKHLEEERVKRAKKRIFKKSILNFFHFLRLYKTPTEKHEKELILKKDERLKRQRRERRKDARKQAILSLLHTIKLYRTREEVEREKERRLRRLREKQRKKEKEYQRKERERQEKRRQKQNEKLRKLEEKKRKKHARILEKARKEREKELTKERREESIKKKRSEIKKYLHNRFGLFRTLEEKEQRREQSYKKKLEKQRKKEQKRLEQLKRIEEDRLKKQREPRKESFKKFLHKHFGLYKTSEELTREKKERLEREIFRKQEVKRKRENIRVERKDKIRAFLHNKFGLFKTRKEKEKARLERKQRRIEIKHKLEDTVLRSLASRLERKRLSPEEEIRILMRLEHEALQKGDTEKSKEIQNKINRLYKKVRKSKPKHHLLLLNKLQNNLESVRGYIFSSASKIENAKIDQINYLVNKAEIELRRNRKEDAKEYYKRAVYLYRSSNKSSQKLALPALLKIKNEITSTAIVDSLEKAFSAVYTGQIKKAEKLYKNIDINFLNLPIAAREKIYDKKEDLYQKIKEQKEDVTPIAQKSSISQKIKNFFKKEKKQKFYPMQEEAFKPKQPQAQPKEEKPKQYTQQRKESLTDFLLARKPKFQSIKTEIESKKHHQNLVKSLFDHIRRAETHLQNKNHEKAHHNYRLAIEMFKDLHLKPEIRDNVYKSLSELKEKILQTSIHNFMKKTKESIKKEEVEDAKKFHRSLEGIYNHLQRKKEKEISEAISEQSTPKIIQDSLFLERKMNEAFSSLRKNKTEEALAIYNQINNDYDNLKPEEKKVLYPRLITLYSELLKRNK